MKLTLPTVILLLATKVSAAGFLNEADRNWQQWPVVGQATLSWYWLDIYSSKLRSPNGYYKQGNDISPHPIALEIRYLRDISQQQLLDATQEQWQKQGYNQVKIETWIQSLTAIFPSVKTGDKLVYVSDGETGEFIYIPLKGAQHVVGHINVESLNDAFLAIWLSPKTQYQKLREQLIGMVRK